MQPTRITATLALTCALAACADMGDDQPLARALDPASLKAGDAVSTSAPRPEWPRRQWWTTLRDPQLDRLMDAALADNPGLHAAQARVRQAQALAGMTQASAAPRLDAAASADRELYSSHSTAPAPLAGHYAWKNSATLSGSYDLDLWGRNRAALAAALDEVQLASAEAQMARLTLETAVLRSYIQLALDYALRDSVLENLAQQRAILEIARRRQAAGLASGIDVTSIEMTLPAGRREQEQLGVAIDLLRNQLAALIGKGPGDGASIARPRLTLAPEPGSALPSVLPAELIGRRPDIAAQRWRVEAAAQRIKQARAGFYPNINLAAFAGLQALGFGHLLDAGSAVRGVAPAISLPLFDGARLRGQLALQNAGYDGALEQYNASVIQALTEVANAVTRARSVQEQQVQSEQALATARRAHTLAERAFRAGLSDSLNTLQARIAVLAEQRQMVLVDSRRLDNFAELMAALGGGIKLDFP